MRLEPGQPGRQLEQHRQELPVGESQQERPVQPERQPGLPPCPEFRRGHAKCEFPTEQIAFRLRFARRAAGKISPRDRPVPVGRIRADRTLRAVACEPSRDSWSSSPAPRLLVDPSCLASLGSHAGAEARPDPPRRNYKVGIMSRPCITTPRILIRLLKRPGAGISLSRLEGDLSPCVG